MLSPSLVIDMPAPAIVVATFLIYLAFIVIPCIRQQMLTLNKILLGITFVRTYILVVIYFKVRFFCISLTSYLFIFTSCCLLYFYLNLNCCHLTALATVALFSKFILIKCPPTHARHTFIRERSSRFSFRALRIECCGNSLARKSSKSQKHTGIPIQYIHIRTCILIFSYLFNNAARLVTYTSGARQTSLENIHFLTLIRELFSCCL